MYKLRATVSTLVLISMTSNLSAQDVTELVEVVIDGGQAYDGFYGDSVEESSQSVSKSETPIAETSRSVSVITQEEMQERGAQSVEHAMQYSPGVVAGQWGLDNRSDWSYVRGFSPTVYHDGLISRYGYYNDTKPETFMLDQVGILSGPSSNIYGNGSVGGVVNTTSKIAGEVAPNILQVSYGSNNRKEVGIDYSGTLGANEDVQYRLVGLWRDADTQVDYQEDNSVAIAPSLAWDITDDTTLKVMLNYQNTETGPLIQFFSPVGVSEPGPNGEYLSANTFVGEPGFDMFNTEQKAITVMLDHNFGNGWNANLNARKLTSTAEYQHAWWAFDNYETDRYNDDGTINRTFYRAESSLDTIGVNGQVDGIWSLGNVAMSTQIGVNYARGIYDTDSGYGTQIGSIDPYDPDYTGYNDITVTDSAASTSEEIGVYLLNRATFFDKLHLDVGLGWSEIETGETDATFSDATISATDDAFTKSFSIMYESQFGLNTYASYSESFTQEVVGSDYEGNPFDPTFGTQYEVGVKYQPLNTNSLFTFAYFDINKSNLAVMDEDNPDYQIQTGEVNARGYELGVSHKFNEISIDASFTSMETEDTDGFAISGVPEKSGSIWVGYEPAALQGFKMAVGARYVGEKWEGGSDVATNPEYTLYDAMIGYETDDWNTSLNIRNLTDNYHTTFCSSYACYLGESRTFDLTVTRKF